MKIICLLALCVCSLSFLLPGVNVEARAKIYPLMCREGGAMKGSFADVHIQLTFVGAKQGAGVRPPQPGECAWLDRGLLPGEPVNFVWYPDNATLRVDFDAQRITRVSSTNSKYNYLANSIVNGDVFQVHAYRGQCPGLKCNFLTLTKVN